MQLCLCSLHTRIPISSRLECHQRGIGLRCSSVPLSLCRMLIKSNDIIRVFGLLSVPCEFSQRTQSLLHHKNNQSSMCWLVVVWHRSLYWSGRCVVYDERTYGLALKLADKIKHQDTADEVKQESYFCSLLADLQGVCIPTLQWSGTFAGLVLWLGLTPRGKVPTALNQNQQDELRRGLALIHSKGAETKTRFDTFQGRPA